jgi:diguanylate cyclase (GGDEF)-like protein/putative nucleotidyltransferase with HDIG domain
MPFARIRHLKPGRLLRRNRLNRLFLPFARRQRLKPTPLLSLGFGLMLLCIVTTVCANLLASNQYQAQTDLMIDRLYPARQEAHTIIWLVLAIDDEGAWYILSNNPKQQAQLLQSYRQNVQALRAAVARARALADTPQQRAALDDFSSYFFGKGGYLADNQTSFAEKQAGQELTADDNYVNSAFFPIVQHDIQAYLDIVGQEITQADVSQDTLSNLVRFLNIGAGGSAVLFGLAIALSIIRMIHRLYRQVDEQNTRLAGQNARLLALSTTDPLTTLPNHRALSERLEQEVARARRYGHPLSILFFDADHFKRVNDSYGHSTGDIVLQELGRLVGSLLRAGDSTGRYGGEEFLVLLPETTQEEACQVAERIRKTVAESPLATSAVKEGIPTTISLGVATFPMDGTTASEVVEQADQAMYWAKRLGRNQVRTSQEAARLCEDEALVATISNLERDSTTDGVSLEEAVRTRQLMTIQSLMWLLDLRDQSIFSHSAQVSDLAGAIARALGESEAQVFAVTTAALLHDLGKIALPDRLLYKAGPLTPTEHALIQQHPTIGAQILEVSPFLHHLMPAVAHHHENWDGTGYPDGLCGENIPLSARIIRVAEAYQAMTTDRPYQRHRANEEARAELARCAGKQFDPTVVQTALRVLTEQEKTMGAETPLTPSTNSQPPAPLFSI